MQKSFGELLRRCRKHASLTLGQLAREIGVSVSYLSDVERGNRAPFGAEHLARAARALGVDLSVLQIEASKARGAFELEPLSPGHQSAGAALMRKWSALPPATLKRIQSIVEPEGDDENT